jgi:hypothetical protein
VITEEPDYELIFGKPSSARILLNFVNQIKTNMIWGCYYPYPLTLSISEHFGKFVRGEMSIITLLDMSAFETNLAKKGVTLEVEANEEDLQCHIFFSDLPGDVKVAHFVIGEHMMCRMWTDFLYPSWIVQNAIESVTNNLNAMIGGSAQAARPGRRGKL